MLSRRFRSIDHLALESRAADGGRVDPASEQKEGADSSGAPRVGLKLMVAIVIGVTLVTLYANMQKGRLDKIEQVIVTPVSTATPPAASPAGE